jgi:hypothetical protein
MLTKKVKDTAQMNEMALSSGGKVTGEDGQQFNSQKKQAVKPRRLEKDPDAVQLPTAPEPPPGPDAGSKLVSDKIVAVGTSTAMMLQEIREQISKIQIDAPEPITHWEFIFERDSKGYLVRLIADGGAPTKLLN